MRSLLPLIGLGLISGPIHAQAAGAGPGPLSKMADSGAFTVAKLTSVGTGIQQLMLVKMPHNPPGTWTVAMTMANLTTTYGGDGTKAGLVSGIYDQAKDTFTPNKDMNAMNTAKPWGVMIEPWRGLYAVADSPPAIAARTTFVKPFGPLKPITNLPTAPDPSIGYVNGKLKIFYFIATQGIVMQDLDPVKLMVSGSAVLVAGIPTTGGRAHSPTPVVGPDGDVEGLLFAENYPGGSTMWFANDLDPATPSLFVNKDTGWQNNGGIAGGQFFWAFSPKYSTAAQFMNVCWMLGDVEDIGGRIDIVAAVGAMPPPPAITAVFLSDKAFPTTTLPGIGGALGINPLLATFLGSISHVSKTQTGQLSFPVPKDPSLKGQTFAIQGVSYLGARGTFTNSAWLKINK